MFSFCGRQFIPFWIPFATVISTWCLFTHLFHTSQTRHVYQITMKPAESFLRSSQPFKQSRNSPRFMIPESSLPCPPQPSTCPYDEPHGSNSRLPVPFKIRFNIIFPSTHIPSKRLSLSLSLSKLFPPQLWISLPWLNVFLTVHHELTIH